MNAKTLGAHRCSECDGAGWSWAGASVFHGTPPPNLAGGANPYAALALYRMFVSSLTRRSKMGFYSDSKDGPMHFAPNMSTPSLARPRNYLSNTSLLNLT